MKINFFKKNNKEKGFTLIEILIVVSIIAVVSALTILNSSGLNSSVLLSNTAYEIGLIVRDAQISGLGSKLLIKGDVVTTFNQGVYFNVLEPTKIILFADLNKNNRYNEGEEIQIFTIEDKRAGKILGVCRVIESTGQCEYGPGWVNVIFKRPNPEAYFYSSSDVGPGPGHFGSYAINIGFEGGDCRTLMIYKTGATQIDKSRCN